MNKQKWFIIVVPIFLVIAALFLTQTGGAESANIIVNPNRGMFRVTVTTTGELRALRNTPIYGPQMARQSRGMSGLTIQKLVPEGTLVEEGDFVAELDKMTIQEQINSLQLTLEQYENNIEQVRLDCTMTLANARNDLINLAFNAEEAKLTMEQSVFEAPAVARQAEISYEKAIRSLNQARDNYDTRVQQSAARMKEAENNLLRRSRDMQQYYDLMSQFTIAAPANGMVIYYRERNGSKRTEGSSVSPFDPI
ncbi:RND transporter, partial [Candidatus Neomarinimicrobiota bacterium]